MRIDMMKPFPTAAVVAALMASTWAGTAHAQTPGVSLVIKDGRVTLKAEQASVRQILAEWERQGQVRVVGADKLAGAPVTISLTDMPERQALDIVMRGVPGYMAVDRAPATTVAASTSRFDRVIVMARAATPVPAAAMASTRPMPSPGQPMMPSAETFVAPAAPDDDTAPVAQPERNDVEQFTNSEPAMPEAPVASPYPNAYPGSPYVGANGANQQVGPYGGNATAAAAAAGTTNGAQPELQFDYANPQKYFEQRRLQQEAAGGQPTAVPGAGTGVNGTNRGSPMPTAMPTANGTLSRPGVAPAPTTPQTTPGEFFNPYNLPADWVPPPPVTADPTAAPVEPDRAKYANPYEQPKPPQE